MTHKPATHLPLHTLDMAIYQSRGSIESARTAAIREIWRDLRAAVFTRTQAIEINPPAAAAA